MFATNWLYFKKWPDSLNETTMKQQMTSISDNIIVCLFQNYKNMWIKRTDTKGKCLSKVVSSKAVTVKYPLTFHDNVFSCLKKKHKKGVSIYHLNTRAIWKRFENVVKRKTHIFEGIFIDPFDNDNPSDHPLNFASGEVTTSAIKESLRKALDKGSQVSISFTEKHLISPENNMPLKSYYDSLPKSDIKVMTEMQKTVCIQFIRVTISGELMY